MILVGDFVEDYEAMVRKRERSRWSLSLQPGPPSITALLSALSLQVPYQAMLAMGYTVDVVSPGKPFPGTVKTAIHDFEGDATYTEKLGHAFALTRSWEEVVRQVDALPSMYEALFLPGGRAPEYLRLDAGVMRVVSAFFEAVNDTQQRRALVVVAVCHGVQFLTALPKGWIPRGVPLTGYPACGPELKAAGFEKWVDAKPDEAVVGVMGTNRGTLITSPAWPGHPAVLKALYAALGTKIEHKEA